VNTPNTINAPASVYYYSHCAINPRTGTTGSRWDYLKHDGIDRPELVHTLSTKTNIGKMVIYMMKPSPKKGSKEVRAAQALFNPSLKKINPKSNGSVSNLNEPDTSRPGCGWGDIQGTEDAILTYRDMKAGTLKIMVFPGMKKQAALLFQNWGSGGVSEAIPNNKLKLDTLSVMNP